MRPPRAKPTYEMPPYKPTYHRGGDHVVGSAVPGPIHDLIDSKDWSGPGALGDLGEQIVKKQLETYAEAQRDAAERVHAHGSLLEHSAAKIVASITGPEDLKALSAIPAQLARKTIWESENLEYSAFRLLRRALESEEAEDSSVGDGEASTFRKRDIDEWILRNERAMRDDKRDDWKHGLVDWTAQADIVLGLAGPTSSTQSQEPVTGPKIVQRGPQSGYTFLDELRASSIALQPTLEAFQATFDSISGGLLKGLDWSNVFVAGGIVLSSLLSVTEKDAQKFSSSDIDLYIYGLGPIEANKKVQHLEEVWKSNLPKNAKNDTLVVRNSRTITFFSQYPIKRVQIVLKLVKSPREVLLNFDLDVCAMGYDGESLLMLPRAARALETGYNVFTMDLVQGHYLGERRASQESRVFKYADKGYGIRILPSYLTVQAASIVDETNTKPPLLKLDSTPDIDAIAARGEHWTRQAFNRYNNHYDPVSIGDNGLPEWTHSMLEERSIITSEPGKRSCLTSFELLMRHVELWRAKIRGEIAMTKEEWASNNYDVGPTGYDDSPLYTWDEEFTIEEFKKALEDFNLKDYEGFRDNAENVNPENGPSRASQRLKFPRAQLPKITPTSTIPAKRIAYSDNVTSLLGEEGTIILNFFAATGFEDFANELVGTVLNENGLAKASPNPPLQVIFSVRMDDENVPLAARRDVDALKWQIDAVLGWQQIDRRIDEVFEILWSFYRSHANLLAQPEDLARKFYTEVSRRAIRPTTEDETMAFANWLLRGAPQIGYSYGGLGQGFFGWTSDDESEFGSDDNDDFFDE